MIKSGNELRSIREGLGISQARFSELVGVSQHLISSFELEKSTLSIEALAKINDLLPNIDKFDNITTRKKRYRKHTYSARRVESKHPQNYRKSPGNTNYLHALRDLQTIPPSSFTGLSLFSGIGGFSLGFRRAGCSIAGFVEINDAISRIYEKNFDAKRVGYDVTEMSTNYLNGLLNDTGPIDVVLGGPPCQGFSLSGKRRPEDPRNYLFEEYLRVIDTISPRIAIMENVRLLTSMRLKNGGLVKDAVIHGFEKYGYHSRIFDINAKQYGLPQHRERVFFVAVRQDIGVPPTFPSPDFGVTEDLFNRQDVVRTFADACSDLPYIESGEATGDPMHRAVSHPDHVIEWLWNVPEGASAHDNTDPALRPPSGYNTTYKRQVWDEPGSTVQTTFGMISGSRNVHPIATRSLTVREAARLQSFPDSYKFVGALSAIRTGIGNAVPPLLARRIAEHVRSIL